MINFLSYLAIAGSLGYIFSRDKSKRAQKKNNDEIPTTNLVATGARAQHRGYTWRVNREIDGGWRYFVSSNRDNDAQEIVSADLFDSLENAKNAAIKAIDEQCEVSGDCKDG